MKQNIKIPIVGLFLLLVLFSCDDEFLKVKPKSFFTPENVYIDKAGFESALIAMKMDLRAEHTGYINYIAAEFSASDLGSPWSQLDFYNLTPSTSRYYPYLVFFRNAYGAIKNTNVVVSRIDDIEWKNPEERNRILAEALWFRAYWYYRLVNTYGDIPFVNGEITSPKLDFYTHSRWTILNKLQEDLEFAEMWLPEKTEAGTPSKGAARHLLTKVYLANLNFDKAIETASKVIEGPYKLMAQRFGIDRNNPVRNLIWDLHRPQNFNLPNNTETILATVDRYEAPPAARTPGLYTMRVYHCAWFQPQVLDSEGKQGMVAEGLMYDSLGRGNANVRLTYHYQYSLWNYKGQRWNNTQDLRRANINWVDVDEILYNNPKSVDFGKPVNVKNFANPIDTFKSIYAMPFYITYAPQQDAKATPVGGNYDWYVFRLAETYLLRAEAYYWKNQLTEAAEDINAVRERANALPVSPEEVTIDFILDERARELFAEEPRHSELIRISYILAKMDKEGYSLDRFSQKNFYYDRVMKYNKTYEQKITQLGNTANMAPFHALWPIPDYIILENTLGVINQNIGYNGAEKNQPPLEKIE
ncbi:RagB/SusD family nutrient uptake outer membrane protein [Phocaeicola abscessus]|uniref:RagB/SusD family nutrient uptake outer membrane protein n=1 Tax=Phocaeicola abscessus TaxID=555313 RepID=UPI002E0E904F